MNIHAGSMYTIPALPVWTVLQTESEQAVMSMKAEHGDFYIIEAAHRGNIYLLLKGDNTMKTHSREGKHGKALKWVSPSSPLEPFYCPYESEC